MEVEYSREDDVIVQATFKLNILRNDPVFFPHPYVMISQPLAWEWHDGDADSLVSKKVYLETLVSHHVPEFLAMYQTECVYKGRPRFCDGNLLTWARIDWMHIHLSPVQPIFFHKELGYTQKYFVHAQTPLVDKEWSPISRETSGPELQEAIEIISQYHFPSLRRDSLEVLDRIFQAYATSRKWQVKHISYCLPNYGKTSHTKFVPWGQEMGRSLQAHPRISMDTFDLNDFNMAPYYHSNQNLQADDEISWPPRHCHMSDQTMLRVIEFRQTQNLGPDFVHDRWPETFDIKGMPHRCRRPMGPAGSRNGKVILVFNSVYLFGAGPKLACPEVKERGWITTSEKFVLEKLNVFQTKIEATSAETFDDGGIFPITTEIFDYYQQTAYSYAAKMADTNEPSWSRRPTMTTSNQSQQQAAARTDAASPRNERTPAQVRTLSKAKVQNSSGMISKTTSSVSSNKTQLPGDTSTISRWNATKPSEPNITRNSQPSEMTILQSHEPNPSRSKSTDSLSRANATPTPPETARGQSQASRTSPDQLQFSTLPVSNPTQLVPARGETAATDTSHTRSIDAPQRSIHRFMARGAWLRKTGLLLVKGSLSYLRRDSPLLVRMALVRMKVNTKVRHRFEFMLRMLNAQVCHRQGRRKWGNLSGNLIFRLCTQSRRRENTI